MNFRSGVLNIMLGDCDVGEISFVLIKEIMVIYVFCWSDPSYIVNGRIPDI